MKILVALTMVAAIVLGGCTLTRTGSGEPSPVITGKPAVTAADSAAPASDAPSVAP